MYATSISFSFRSSSLNDATISLIFFGFVNSFG
jgi:hypothetical protein